jgi:hypothetical protein
MPKPLKKRVVGKRGCPECGSIKYVTDRYDGFENVYQCQNCYHKFKKQIDCYTPQEAPHA